MGINDDEINNQARTLFFRGNELFNKDLFLEAKNAYEKALGFFPERRSILYNLSLTCYHLEDFFNASLHIKKLIEIGYKDQEIINLFVEICLKKKN